MEFSESIREMMKRLSKSLDSPKKPGGEQFISADEIETLVISLSESRENGEFTEEEAQTIVKWAIDARLQYTMLALVLKRIVEVTVEKGEVSFKIDPDLKLPDNYNVEKGEPDGED